MFLPPLFLFGSLWGIWPTTYYFDWGSTARSPKLFAVVLAAQPPPVLHERAPPFATMLLTRSELGVIHHVSTVATEA